MNNHRDHIRRIAILLRGKGLLIAGLLAMIALWALPALGLAQGGAGVPDSVATIVLISLILGWLF